MPVKAHVYRTIAEFNQGFEKLLNDLDMLHRISFLRSERLAALQQTVCKLRAQANREFLVILHEREAVNAGHFEQLLREGDGATRETAAE